MHWHLKVNSLSDILRTFTSTGDDDDEDDDDYVDVHGDVENERPADKYKKPKEYSFAGLILSRLIRESCKCVKSEIFFVTAIATIRSNLVKV